MVYQPTSTRHDSGTDAMRYRSCQGASATRSLAEDQYDSVQPEAGRVTELVSELVASRAWACYPLVAPTVIELFLTVALDTSSVVASIHVHAWPAAVHVTVGRTLPSLHDSNQSSSRQFPCSDVICDSSRCIVCWSCSSLENKPCCIVLNKADVVANCHQMDSVD